MPLAHSLPTLTSSYQLQSNSPAIDAGVDAGLTQDYTGTSIPQGFAPDIGAYECVKPLYVKLNASPTSGNIPLTVKFSCNVMGNHPPFNYQWNFGDDNSSTEQNPTHTYSVAGEYTSTLTITDNNNNQESNNIIIRAYNPVKRLLISSITDFPSPGDGGTTDPPPGTHFYSIGSTIQINAIPNNNYRFSKWTGDVNIIDIYKKKINIFIDTDKSISAHFCTKCGDVNGDLRITPLDAQTAFDIFLGKINSPTRCQKENADVNCDGSRDQANITPSDAQAIFEKYLGKSELPCDCSCSSRAKSYLIRTGRSSEINLTVKGNQVDQGDEIDLLIIVHNNFPINSFGLDLFFPLKTLEFISIDNKDLLTEFWKIGANEIWPGIIRIGGYKIKPDKNKSKTVIINLIFKAKINFKSEPNFLIINTLDDVENASLKYHTIDNKRLVYK